jgi:formate dehydrogenase subunit delta
MSPDKLVRMANQIASFFTAQDAVAAPTLVAKHLRQFWDPRMRTAIIAHQAAGGVGLEPVAAAAVTLLMNDEAA